MQLFFCPPWSNRYIVTWGHEPRRREIPGFVSSSFHRSLDGHKVTMYAQWKSIVDYQNMRNNPVASPYLEQALKIATFEPGMYEVVESFLAESL